MERWSFWKFCVSALLLSLLKCRILSRSHSLHACVFRERQCESSSCLTSRGQHWVLSCCLFLFTSQHVVRCPLSLADHQRKFGEDYGSCQAGISNFLTEVSNTDATSAFKVLFATDASSTAVLCLTSGAHDVFRLLQSWTSSAFFFFLLMLSCSTENNNVSFLCQQLKLTRFISKQQQKKKLQKCVSFSWDVGQMKS